MCLIPNQSASLQSYKNRPTHSTETLVELSPSHKTYVTTMQQVPPTLFQLPLQTRAWVQSILYSKGRGALVFHLTFCPSHGKSPRTSQDCKSPECTSTGDKKWEYEFWDETTIQDSYLSSQALTTKLSSYCMYTECILLFLVNIPTGVSIPKIPVGTLYPCTHKRGTPDDTTELGLFRRWMSVCNVCCGINTRMYRCGVCEIAVFCTQHTAFLNDHLTMCKPLFNSNTEETNTGKRETLIKCKWQRFRQQSTVQIRQSFIEQRTRHYDVKLQ
jgi:hypothetical protein